MVALNSDVEENDSHGAGTTIASPAGPIEILAADAELVVVSKPCGLLSVPGIGPEKADCLVARLQEAFPGVRIVHRLDRDTSGAMVLARSAASHRHLSVQFQERRVRKRYVAWVAGCMDVDAGEIDEPIRKDMDRPPRQLIDAVSGRPSLTRFVVDQRRHDRTRVELHPVTGRSHQLRLHLCHIGHPILGDDLYAPPAIQEMAPRLQLHATFLGLHHPVTGAALEASSSPPF